MLCTREDIVRLQIAAFIKCICADGCNPVADYKRRNPAPERIPGLIFLSAVVIHWTGAADGQPAVLEDPGMVVAAARIRTVVDFLRRNASSVCSAGSVSPIASGSASSDSSESSSSGSSGSSSSGSSEGYSSGSSGSSSSGSSGSSSSGSPGSAPSGFSGSTSSGVSGKSSVCWSLISCGSGSDVSAPSSAIAEGRMAMHIKSASNKANSFSCSPP